jgi:hypothetical protein
MIISERFCALAVNNKHMQIHINFSVRVVLFFLFSVSRLYSQEVIWANRVLEVSNDIFHEDTFPQYNSIQILGKPNVLPQSVSSPCSWKVIENGKAKDSIYVSFEKPIKIKQIIVGETVNPGAIIKITGFSISNLEYVLFEKKGQALYNKEKLWNLFIPETLEEIRVLKLEISHKYINGDKEYDAIGISNSDEPFVPRINLPIDIDSTYKPINLGKLINSKFGEVAPIISSDEKTIFFTRSNHPDNIKVSEKKKESQFEIKQDIWFSKLNENEEWGKPVNLGEPINNISNNAAVSISDDGNSLFILNVYLPNGKFVAGLSKSTFIDNKWEWPKQIKIENFQALEVYNEISKRRVLETEYAVSPDQDILIMGLKRQETFGHKDLYVSFKIAENSYSTPKNLGNIVNSAAREGAPFLASDNKTLYFHSSGHPGFGETDIYMTKRLDDSWTNWSEPINLGPFINSSKWDGYLTIPFSGEFGYFSSANNSLGSDDLFKIKLSKSIKPD